MVTYIEPVSPYSDVVSINSMAFSKSASSYTYTFKTSTYFASEERRDTCSQDRPENLLDQCD